MLTDDDGEAEDEAEEVGEMAASAEDAAVDAAGLELPPTEPALGAHANIRVVLLVTSTRATVSALGAAESEPRLL